MPDGTGFYVYLTDRRMLIEPRNLNKFFRYSAAYANAMLLERSAKVPKDLAGCSSVESLRSPDGQTYFSIPFNAITKAESFGLPHKFRFILDAAGFELVVLAEPTNRPPRVDKVMYPWLDYINSARAGGHANQTPQYRTCPVCAQTILVATKKCKHCGSDV